MKKIIQVLVSLILLAIIWLCVYVSTIASVEVTSKKFDSNEVKHVLKSEITDFNNWKNWASLSGIEHKVITGKKKIGKKIKVNTDGKGISIENHFVSDTLIVQNIYGYKAKKASNISWKFQQGKLYQVQLTEYLGFFDKLKLAFGNKQKVSWLKKIVLKSTLNIDKSPSIFSLKEDIINVKNEKNIQSIQKDSSSSVFDKNTLILPKQ